MDGWEFQQQTNWTYPQWREPGRAIAPLPFALFDKQGEWTLSYTPHLYTAEGPKLHPTHGPWVFTFIVP